MIDKRIFWEKWLEKEPIPLDEEGEEIIPKLFTPIGYVSQKLYAGNRNDFKFWAGNTNFPITKTVAETINRSEGVEVFNIFTQYKFRISPGKLFKISEVKRNIEINLDCRLKFGLSTESYYEIKSIQVKLKKSRLPWIIYILPNGRYEWTQFQDIDQFKDEYDKYYEANQTINGFILSSGV